MHVPARDCLCARVCVFVFDSVGVCACATLTPSYTRETPEPPLPSAPRLLNNLTHCRHHGDDKGEDVRTQGCHGDHIPTPPDRRSLTHAHRGTLAQRKLGPYIQTHTHAGSVTILLGGFSKLTTATGGDNLQTLLLQLRRVLSRHFSGKLSSFLFTLSNIIPSLSKQLSSGVLLSLSVSLCLSLCSRGLTLRGGVGEQ